MSDDPGQGSAPVVLKGGIANAGAVVRIGDTVRRPAAPQVDHVHDFMRHLRAAQCQVVPEPLGFDDDGREILRWIPGDTAAAPWPGWVADEKLLVSLAEVQRLLHRSADGYAAAPDAPWATTAGNYFPPGANGTLMCHNDLNMTNVVVDQGQVVGVVDWDFAAPASPLFDIAVAARHWVPFAPPKSRIEPLRDADPVRRWTVFADAHGLNPQQRTEALSFVPRFIEQAGRNIANLAERDGPDSGYQTLLDSGYLTLVANTLEWMRRHELWH